MINLANHQHVEVMKIPHITFTTIILIIQCFFIIFGIQDIQLKNSLFKCNDAYELDYYCPKNCQTAKIFLIGYHKFG